MLIEKGLKQALIKNEFYLVYQPQINLNTNEVSGFEVLIRWNSSELGNVPPFEFISKSEDIGIIHDIGLWVLKTTCQQFNEWKPLFEDFNINPTLSVNVSSIQLMHDNILGNIKEVLSTFNYSKSTLIIELTESAFINNNKKSKSLLDEINGLGVGLAVDDFGTGYSSFSYLKDLPFAELKIDKSFIDKIDIDKNGRSIIKAIIKLAEVMDLDIVAQGVEDQEQLSYLKKYNRELVQKIISVQGYFFSKPPEVQDVLPFINAFINENRNK